VCTLKLSPIYTILNEFIPL